MRSFSALVSRMVSVLSRRLFSLIFIIPFVIIVGSGYRPITRDPRKVAGLFGKGATAQQAKLLPCAAKRAIRASCDASADSRMLCLPQTKVWEIKTAVLTNAPNLRFYSSVGFYSFSLLTALKPPTNRSQGRKERMCRMFWKPLFIRTYGTFVTGRERIIYFQKLDSVTAVAAIT